MMTIYQLRKQLPGNEKNPIEILKESFSKNDIYQEAKTMRRLNDGYDYWMFPKIIKEKENVQRV